MADTNGLWAVVEIMGHRTRAGMISDATLGGATMLRIEHPTLADHTGEEPLTELYAPSAIFAVRLCSRDEALSIATWCWKRPSFDSRPALPSALDGVEDVDDDEDWIVDVEIVED